MVLVEKFEKFPESLMRSTKKLFALKFLYNKKV